jgi:capsular polysaccharide biosynthesis protein
MPHIAASVLYLLATALSSKPTFCAVVYASKQTCGSEVTFVHHTASTTSAAAHIQRDTHTHPKQTPQMYTCSMTRRFMVEDCCVLHLRLLHVYFCLTAI